MDYFLARYYSTAQGRFTSPDEFTGGPDELYDFAEQASTNPTFYADIVDPQTLNKYQYCLNNPFKYVDPDGHQQSKKTLTEQLKESANAILQNVWDRFRPHDGDDPKDRPNNPRSENLQPFGG